MQVTNSPYVVVSTETAGSWQGCPQPFDRGSTRHPDIAEGVFIGDVATFPPGDETQLSPDPAALPGQRERAPGKCWQMARPAGAWARENVIWAIRMPVSELRPCHAVLTARLRAAGCVFAEDEAQLLLAAALAPAELEVMITRRVLGVPLEHLLGWAEFCGLRIHVAAAVFVPRRRTEFLVDQAAALIRRSTTPAAGAPVVVDLCCGSGAVGAALLAIFSTIELYAADIDPVAVDCARRNIAGRGRVLQGDLYEPLPIALRERVDIVVANTPYVPTEAIGMMPPEARLHENRIALDGGGDGLDVQRRVAAASSLWLAPGGHLLVESSARQAQHAAEVFARNGLLPRIVSSVVSSSDELQATVVIGTKPAQ